MINLVSNSNNNTRAGRGLSNLPENVLQHVASYVNNNRNRARMEATSRALRVVARAAVLRRDPTVRAAADMIREVAEATKRSVIEKKQMRNVLHAGRFGNAQRSWALGEGVVAINEISLHLLRPRDDAILTRTTLRFNIRHEGRRYAMTVELHINDDYSAEFGQVHLIQYLGGPGIGTIPKKEVFYIDAPAKHKAVWALTRGMELYNLDPVKP